MRPLLIVLAIAAGVQLPLAAHGQSVQQLDAEVTALRASGRSADAIGVAQRLVDLAERSTHPLDAQVGQGLIRLATVYEDVGRYADAENHMRRALAVVETNRYANPNLKSVLLGSLARLALRQGRDQEAARYYAQALELLGHFADASRAVVTQLRFELGQLYATAGDTRAEDLLRAVQEALVADGKAESPLAVRVLRAQALLAQRGKHYEQAAARYAKACEIAERMGGPEDLATAVCWHEMATNAVLAGQPRHSAAVQAKALVVLEASPAVSMLQRSDALVTMAQIQLAGGDHDAAYANASRALDTRIRLLGDAHLRASDSAQLVARIEEARGHGPEAQAMHARAQAIRQAAEARLQRRAVTQPRDLTGLRFAYPEAARRAGYEGLVMVRALVNDDGAVGFANVQDSSGYRMLDEAAVKAVLGARFTPATDAQGQPAGAMAYIPLRFKLEPASHVANAPAPSYGQRLAQTLRQQIVYANVHNIAGNPQAVVVLRAGADGAILERTLLESSGVAQWDAAVLTAVDKVGVLPLDVDGKVPARLELAFRPKY